MATLTDAELVQRILGGDTAALSILYDRYADRIHTMCVHMLRNDDDAADVTAEVFLTAAERLGQLRDHDKLRPWLYAIARNEVYRRSRHRGRETSLDALGSIGLELGDDALDVDAFESAESMTGTAEVVELAVHGRAADAGGGDVELEAGATSADLADLLQDASAGLDERDRMVLELHLAQGLDGQELADALGVSRDNGYQLVHRMKDRLERATSALLIARSGRSMCDGLDEVADTWDGNFSVLWRKRFARHIERCDRCSSLRSRVPKAVLAGTALALAAQSTVLAAPISARERFLSEAPQRMGSTRSARWRSDGFPPHAARRRRWPFAAGAVVLALLAVLGGSTLLDHGSIEELVMSGPTTVPGASPTVASSMPPGSTVPLLPGDSTPADGPASGDETTTTTSTIINTGAPAPPEAGVPRVATTAVPTPVPAPPPEPPPTEPSTTTTTTAPPDTTGPSVNLSGPPCVKWGGAGTFTASASDPSGITSVTISWSGAAAGSRSTSGSSLSVTVPFPSSTTKIGVIAVAVDGAGNTGRTAMSVIGGPTCP